MYPMSLAREPLARALLLREFAWAKINLALDVGALRQDGYHEVRMLMQTVSLCDQVTIRLDTGRWWADGGDALPHDTRNLALRAAEVFCHATGFTPDGMDITLEKHIPAGAGLGGGSADAAAVLRALQRHCNDPLTTDALLALAARVGSDVPFCLLGGTALAEGRGERLTPLQPLADCEIVLCKPDFFSSTPALYRALDGCPPTVHPDLPGLTAKLHNVAAFGAGMYNVFEPLLTAEHTELADIRRILMDCGAAGAMLTGTGSAMFGLFTDPDAAECAAAALRRVVPWVERAKPVAKV